MVKIDPMTLKILIDRLVLLRITVLVDGADQLHISSHP